MTRLELRNLLDKKFHSKAVGVVPVRCRPLVIIEHCPINTLDDVCYYARLMAYRENQLGLIGYICRSRSRAFSDTSHKYERAYTQRYGELENIMDAQ